MAMKGSKSTINNQVKPIIQISSELDKIIEGLVSSLKNYDIFPGIDYLNRHQAVIDCRKSIIIFPRTEYVLQCQKGMQARFSATAIPENTPNFFQEFPEVCPCQKPTV
jgi:D-Tyr-tRNAtyr deacylase